MFDSLEPSCPELFRYLRTHSTASGILYSGWCTHFRLAQYFRIYNHRSQSRYIPGPSWDTFSPSQARSTIDFIHTLPYPLRVTSKSMEYPLPISLGSFEWNCRIGEPPIASLEYQCVYDDTLRNRLAHASQGPSKRTKFGANVMNSL